MITTIIHDEGDLEGLCNICGASVYCYEVVEILAEKIDEKGNNLIRIAWIHDHCWLTMTLSEKRKFVQDKIIEGGYDELIKKGPAEYFPEEQIKSMNEEAYLNMITRLRIIVQKIRTYQNSYWAC